MEEDKYITLIYKDLKREISSEELKDLKAWLQLDKKNQQLAKQIRKDWDLAGSYLPPIEIDEQADFEKLQQRIRAQDAQPVQKTHPINLPTRRRSFLSWTAAAVLLLLIGWWFYIYQPIIPKMVKMETTSGEKHMVELTDGTKVWLNENSVFSYPENGFKERTRDVNLQGEVYFEVAKNDSQPFVIHTSAAHVTVLGTSFNVRALSSESTVEVTVDEGRVKLQPKGKETHIIINSKRKGVYQINNQVLEEFPVVDKNITFWKTGALIFNNTPLSQVLSDLDRYFNTTAILSNPSMQNCFLTARFPDATAIEILDHLALSFQMELERTSEGNFRLKNGVCN